MKNNSMTLPPKNIPQSKDMEIDNFDGGLDDSDVLIHAVIKTSLRRQLQRVMWLVLVEG